MCTTLFAPISDKDTICFLKSDALPPARHKSKEGPARRSAPEADHVWNLLQKVFRKEIPFVISLKFFLGRKLQTEFP
jgi:hypothetical protein